jgi:hypothetical protein
MKAPQPDPLLQVFLNHFYVVLDSPTYKAVEGDAFLRLHFAVNEKRTTTNADVTYTGLYFYGCNGCNTSAVQISWKPAADYPKIRAKFTL